MLRELPKLEVIGPRFAKDSLALTAVELHILAGVKKCELLSSALSFVSAFGG